MKNSKDFNIPRRTLRHYLQGGADKKKKIGPKPTLNEEDEKNFCTRILHLADLGFPIISAL